MCIIFTSVRTQMCFRLGVAGSLFMRLESFNLMRKVMVMTETPRLLARFV